MAHDFTAFAKKRALISFVVAGLINAVVLLLALSGKSEVPLFALSAEKWNQSFIGALIPRALVISIIVTFLTVWITLKAHTGDAERVPWFRITLITAVIRSILAFILVLGLAFVLRAMYPSYAEASTTIVIPLVALFAGAVAAYMTYSAVLTTENILHSED